MARARALSLDDSSLRYSDSLISDFQFSSVNSCRRSLSEPSLRSAPIDYDFKSSLSVQDAVSHTSESINLSQSFPETPSPVLKPLPVFERSLRTQPAKKDEGLRAFCERFTTKQVNVEGIRMRARERRMELRYKRDAVVDLEMEFMKKLNQLLIDVRNNTNTANPDPTLLNTFEQYQNARNDYSSLEDEYDRLEDQLDKEEFELGGVVNNLKQVVDGGITMGDLVDEPTTGLGAAVPKVNHPLVAQYFIRTGDVALLNEELWNLRAEYGMVLEDQDFKHKYGMSVVDYNALDLLANFEQYVKEILDDLATAENDVQLLKSQCDEQGLLEDSRESSKPRASLLETIKDPPHMKWDEKSPSFFEENRARETFVRDKISMTDYIDKWLLHQLFHSTLDRLRTTPELKEFPYLRPGDWDTSNRVNITPTGPSGVPSSHLYMATSTNDIGKVMSGLSPDNLDSCLQTPKLEPINPILTEPCGISSFQPSKQPSIDDSAKFDRWFRDNIDC
ncbi:predicted protein [Uncinocarpus reesii 1704]|uniref:Uncharacterized protein n=1 Tax=Uncinocarpus reesii (strain UAMH 1704) TaxID=336963 RepID=C4JXH6_UNCRE|nr:uncharacterized protein UREG_06349 [Uncinocarpus reesii 1704]EEP81484.1 predicted protein [Uncinocarpus reesii 1704]